MLVDYQNLSSEALHGLAREFVISQISDHEVDVNLETWIQQTLNQIKQGLLVIEFSQADESVTLKSVDDIVFSDEQQDKNNDPFGA
jgi:uncharacterized protein